MKLLRAGSIGDKKGVLTWSKDLGFLTGLESQSMLTAHLNSFMLLVHPFTASSNTYYDFKNAGDLSSQVRAEIPTMLRERLTPPPDESYSLHRKLSGCFMLCTALGARVPCAQIFNEVSTKYTDLLYLFYQISKTKWMHRLNAHLFPNYLLVSVNLGFF